MLANSISPKPQKSPRIEGLYSRLKHLAFQFGPDGSCQNGILVKFSVLLRPILIASFLTYAYLSYIPILRQLSKKSIVICDRYFFDWIFHLFGETSVNLVSLLPKPDLVLLLDIPVSLAFKRMSYAEDRNKPADYYESLRNWYQTVAERIGFVTIDASEEFENTKKQITDRVMPLLGD
jgi:thymidylate kinase